VSAGDPPPSPVSGVPATHSPPAPHTGVWSNFVQFWHVPPVIPQFVSAVPGAHAPVFVMHPVLHV